MKNIRHLMNERLVGSLMKPFIDECGIIHIAYMATATFLSKEEVTTSGSIARSHIMDQTPPQ